MEDSGGRIYNSIYNSNTKRNNGVFGGEMKKKLMLLFYIYTHILKIWKLDVDNKIMLY